MPNPRWKPLDFTPQQSAFGRSEVTWIDPPEDIVQWSRWQAARTQHGLVRALREHMGERLERKQWDEQLAFRYAAPFSRVGLYAVITQTPYARAKEVWAGRAPMHLEEVYAAQRILGPSKG